MSSFYGGGSAGASSGGASGVGIANIDQNETVVLHHQEVS